MILKEDFYMFSINAIFGKTMETWRKRINIKLTSSEDIFTKHAAKADFLMCYDV